MGRLLSTFSVAVLQKRAPPLKLGSLQALAAGLRKIRHTLWRLHQVLAVSHVIVPEHRDYTFLKFTECDCLDHRGERPKKQPFGLRLCRGDLSHVYHSLKLGVCLSLVAEQYPLGLVDLGVDLDNPVETGLRYQQPMFSRDLGVVLGHLVQARRQR